MNKIKKHIGFVLLGSAMMVIPACTDTWNEHYDVTEGGMADQPSLLQNIQSDASLANFYRVLNSIEMADALDAAQQLTVWAPRNLTDAQADSIIAVYNADKTAGLKKEDNKAITQFYQNHVALYARPISSLTDDTVAMLNKKYMHLIGTSDKAGTLSGNAFDDAVISNNGILYKTKGIQPFFPNVREYIEKREGMDSIVQMIKKFDEYELDEKSSVAGGVEDGKTVYLDSVTVLSNNLLSSLGYIQREDSVYTLLAPTDEVWAKLYEKYRQYYVYDPSVNNADSLAEYNTRWSIMRGRFFNTSANNKYNRNPQDSLVNTYYYERQSHNPRSNVYYKPYETILNGLQKVTCSNGEVYIDDKGVIDPRTTFFGRTDLRADLASYYEVPKNSANEETMNVNRWTYYKKMYYTDSTEVVTKAIDYITVSAKGSGDQSKITYTLPNILSGAYYNIYVVTMGQTLPTWFQIGHTEKNARGNFPSEQYWENPHPITAESEVDNVNEILSLSKSNTCFVSKVDELDTLLVQKAVQFPNSSVGLDDGVAKLVVRSMGPSSRTKLDVIYTRTLSLCEFILVPFETKEEAEAAADDMDAFNDELLEANKEN